MALVGYSFRAHVTFTHNGREEQAADGTRVLNALNCGSAATCMHRRVSSRHRYPPGPTREVAKKLNLRDIQTYQTLHAEFGDIFMLPLGDVPLVVTRSPQHIKSLLGPPTRWSLVIASGQPAHHWLHQVELRWTISLARLMSWQMCSSCSAAHRSAWTARYQRSFSACFAPLATAASCWLGQPGCKRGWDLPSQWPSSDRLSRRSTWALG